MGALTERDPCPGGRDDRLLAWPTVRDITGLSRTTAWRMQKTGDFPLPVLVSPGRVGWWESELAAWKATRAPRRPAEARPFGSPGGRPAARSAAMGQRRKVEEDVERRAAPGDAGEGTQQGAAAPQGASHRRSGRRSKAPAPGQIAFDFGS
ncbi:helix-turn-helix transcriptional regulator [Brevundimonas nasdae]|uniref:helix-turn-helix transcriptional regulator n=1 Tax=Brevundimonas nasdae TaxID=172043 RepID=UPI003F69358A